MFCSKCGKSNPDGAKFCKYCGNKFELINAPAVTPGVPARRVQVSKLNILVAAQVIVIALLIYAGKMLADRYYSPGYIASQYFECLMNGHPEKAYSYCIENSGTGFISKDMYCSVLGSGNKKVTSYKIKETDRGFSSARYKITYRVAGENKNYKMDVTVEDDKSSKKLFLFSNWKVNMSDFICKDYLVYAPENSEVKLDGILLAEENTEKGYDEETGAEYYKIDAIFNGEHFIEIHNVYFQDVKGKFNISDDEAEQYYFPDIYMRKDVLEQVAKDTKKKFRSIMQAAGDSDYSSVINKCVAGDNQYASSNSLDEAIGYDYGYNKLLVEDILIEASDYASEDGLDSNCIATVEVTADVYYIYTDNFYGRDYYDNDANVEMTAYFFYEIGSDGKLQINNIKFYGYSY